MKGFLHEKYILHNISAKLFGAIRNRLGKKASKLSTIPAVEKTTLNGRVLSI